MPTVLRFLRLLGPALLRQWRELLSGLWVILAAISIFANGGPVADMPYTLLGYR